jgi:hypothetical protein
VSNKQKSANKDSKQNRKEGKECRKKKRNKRALEEQIMREIEASDSDDAAPIQSDKYNACEQPYGDGFIQCTNCARRFHVTCVEADLICEADELPFECKYC